VQRFAREMGVRCRPLLYVKRLKASNLAPT
jgi:hypothetical protein